MTTAVAPNVDVIASDNIGFDYTFCPISDLRVETEQDKKSGRVRVKHVLVQDEPVPATDRFWTSLYARYGFNNAFFKYFRHDEVFNRIAEKHPQDQLRLCVERGDKSSRLLAVSAPNNPVVSFDELHGMLGRYGGEKVTYANGIIESVHQPRNGGGHVQIGSDLFDHRFILSCPIDGYGKPNVYLAMLRQLCANGLVGYTKAFRSTLSIGRGADDVSPSLVRCLEGFGNDEGYAALRQRIEAAQQSWASVYEANTLSRLIYKLHTGRAIDDLGGQALPKGTSIAQWYQQGRDKFSILTDSEDAVLQAPIFRAFEEMTGSPTRLYGIANIDSLSSKRQRTLPVQCTVYDLVNFATEVATHYSQPEGARKLQGWVGERMVDEYDMENTKEKFTDFKDFHVSARLDTGLTGSQPSVN